jgi:NAD(P)-dependent dehydrogenase (short-subunit alcohol dehydrogenase family)
MASTTKIFHHSSYAAISPTKSENDQSGRTILIIGASSGIGFAIAKAFMQAKAGRVILTGRRKEALEQATQTLRGSFTTSEVVPIVCDIHSEHSIKDLWQHLSLNEMFVDVLVINAADASTGSISPVREFLPQLRTVMETNLFGQLFAVSSFLDQPQDEHVGRLKAIINISSFAAHANPSPLQAAYSVSKASLAHTLQLLADEMPVDRCHIVNVHPGAILTEAAEKAPQEVKDAVVWDDCKSIAIDEVLYPS